MKTIFILDYDDTMIPSTFMQSYLDAHPEVTELAKIEIFERLQHLLLTFLKMVVDKGYKIYVVTNAEEGWVRVSGQSHFPKLYVFLKTHASIISARSAMEPDLPGHLELWKTVTFRAILALEGVLDPERKETYNLIFVGDNIRDYNSAFLAVRNLSNRYFKFLKFFEQASAQELCQCWSAIILGFEALLMEKKDLNYIIPKSVQAACVGAVTADST